MPIADERLEDSAAILDVQVADVDGEHGPPLQREIQRPPTPLPRERKPRPPDNQLRSDFSQRIEVGEILSQLVVVAIRAKGGIHGNADFEARRIDRNEACWGVFAETQEIAAINDVGKRQPVQAVLSGGGVVGRIEAEGAHPEFP